MLVDAVKEQEGLTRRAQLHLIDLAGSERQKDAKTEGATFKETTLINQSLTTLGRVISALVDMSNGPMCTVFSALNGSCRQRASRALPRLETHFLSEGHSSS